MASYVRNGNGSFFDEQEDVDDDEFLRNRRTGDASNDNIDERRRELLMKRKEIEERTIKSTEKSLSYLRSSEEVGAATAEELLRQREQLERTERKLDDINSTLRFSQRHIQGIKSVFGGLKNLISGKNLPSQPQKPTEPISTSRLSNDPLAQKDKSFHPGLRIHNLSSEDTRMPANSSAHELIDENLGQMLTSISRLKGLAHGLSEEIDSQNDMIDNVLEKAERADSTIHKQNKDITKLLK